MKKVDYIIRQAHCVRPEGTFVADVAIAEGVIQDIGENLDLEGHEEIDARGLHLLPGIIDSQVHFREPGLTHKEDLESGSRSALRGGVTTFLEMPNTKPATTSVEAISEKIELAKAKSHVDFGFFIGANGKNLEEIKEATELEGCCGIKIFLGSSTGDLLLYNEKALEEIFKEIPKTPIAVHSENEELLVKNIHIRNQAKDVHAHPEWRSVEVALSSTKRIVKIARNAGRGLHILHISTAEEIDFLKDHKDLFTLEVTPQHLTLCAPECYNKLGTYAQMNPPIREARHQNRLWKAIKGGVVDVIGSDHAPHTKEEKQQKYPKSPSGMPGVQTIFPVMLSHVDNEKLTLEQLVYFLCESPAKLYGLKDRGRLEPELKADLVLIDRNKKTKISNQSMASKCGWTPFDGLEYHGEIKSVFLNAKKIFEDSKILIENSGRPIKNR